MRVYAILLLFIHKIFANDSEVFNVGTVLFSPDDLKKDDWSVTDVSLLRARRYFQYVLPHPYLVDPSIDHFADLILDYFANAVNVVKRENTDTVSTDILTTAIFDTIGGYMKSIVLPVTKYGYYGGTVSKDDAQKLYRFYDDIKTYLKTDGSGWRSFDGKFQKPLKIIATVPRDYIRAARESCDKLAFYEESPSGFTIPLPFISFDNQAPAMFVPLKGQPIISLHSPGSADTLLNYYYAAKNCLKSRSPNDVTKFDKRIKVWLTDDVIAHLDDGSDGELYYALGGILTLATDQKYMDRLFLTPKSYKPYIHIKFGSKKVMILAIILFLEIVWCIPALLYMLYRRRKKKESSDMLLFVNPNKYKDQFGSSSGVPTHSSMTTSCDENTCESVKKFKKKYFRIDDTRHSQNPSNQHFETQTPVISKCSRGTSNQSCLCSKQISTGSYIIENENQTTKPMRSALKNSSATVFDAKSSHFAKPKLFESYNNVEINCKPSIQNVGVKYLGNNELPLQGDKTCKTKNRKSKENILSKSRESANYIRQSSDEQAVIQINSHNSMGQFRYSSKSIKGQQSFKELSDVCQSSADTLTQGKSKTDSTILPTFKNKAKVSHKTSEEERDLHKPGTTQKVEDKTIRRSKKSTLREYKSYNNTIKLCQSHEYEVVLRKSDDDARTQRKSIQDVLIPRKPKQNLTIQNNTNNNLRKKSNSEDITTAIEQLKNEVTHFGEHVNDVNDKDQRNDDTTALRQSTDKEQIFAEPSNALKIIENLDHEAKILQKSANELLQLMDERKGPCCNPICECSCCHSMKNEKSTTEMAELKTCATITLIPDDDSSEKSIQSLKTIYREQPETNLAANTSRPFINTSVLSTIQTKPGINSRNSSLNPLLKTSKSITLLDAQSSEKEEITDLTRKPEKKDENSVKKENKDLTKKHKKVEKITEKKIEEKIEKKAEKSKRNFGFKFISGKRALFEVQIEKPHASISVGITRGNAKCQKISRIPTRIARDNLVRFDDTVRVIQRRQLEAPMGSKIPLPVKRTTDDIVIRQTRNKATLPDPRLNVTL